MAKQPKPSPYVEGIADAVIAEYEKKQELQTEAKEQAREFMSEYGEKLLEKMKIQEYNRKRQEFRDEQKLIYPDPPPKKYMPIELGEKIDKVLEGLPDADVVRGNHAKYDYQEPFRMRVQYSPVVRDHRRGLYKELQNLTGENDNLYSPHTKTAKQRKNEIEKQVYESNPIYRQYLILKNQAQAYAEFWSIWEGVADDMLSWYMADLKKPAVVPAFAMEKITDRRAEHIAHLDSLDMPKDKLRNAGGFDVVLRDEEEQERLDAQEADRVLIPGVISLDSPALKENQEEQVDPDEWIDEIEI